MNYPTPSSLARPKAEALLPQRKRGTFLAVTLMVLLWLSSGTVLAVPVETALKKQVESELTQYLQQLGVKALQQDIQLSLPGSLDEKMRPWLQPIHDALDLLMRPNVPLGPKRKQPKPWRRRKKMSQIRRQRPLNQRKMLLKKEWLRPLQKLLRMWRPLRLLRRPAVQPASAICLSETSRCMAFCSFSKARTSIWRTRSRLTL